MDSACFIANGRDGGGNLSLLLTKAFQAKNTVITIYQEQNFPQCLVKEQKDSPVWAKKDNQEGRGRRDGRVCSQARQALCSEPKPPWGLTIQAGKMWTVIFCAFPFKVVWQWKTIRNENTGQSDARKETRSLFYQRRLWREAHGIPQDTIIFQAAVPGGSHPCLTSG